MPARIASTNENTTSLLKKPQQSFDPFEMTIDDPEHAFSERRFISIGASFRERLLVVSYTERLNRIRIINARNPTRVERRVYEED